MFVELILGIDLACRTAHLASLARPNGTFVWSGRKFSTRHYVPRVVVADKVPSY
jgi:hypothetical protein